ncbi:MAG: response regulator [Alphaproteobacteria bacterium]
MKNIPETPRHENGPVTGVRHDSMPAVRYETAATVTPDLEKVNILIVDDLPEKLIVYRTILEELNQNLIFASSGEEALKVLLNNDFAVILLDVNMPGMDGFETASLVRKRRKSSRTPIIFLTAFVDDVHAAQGYATGAVDYLLTPVMPEILKAKVRVFIELHQMRHQAAMQAEERARRHIAEESERRKDAFLGMLAHELRNPLGPIRNAINLLQQMGPDTPRIVQLRDIIDRQITHMTRLVDDLLDSTRLARGKVLLRKERCDLVRLVRQTVDDYRNIFEQSKLKLGIELPEAPVWVQGDPTRLVQMVGNLLHNAHKFTSEGGAVSVKVWHDARTKSASVSVSDTGIGIDAQMLPHIFDLFQQAEQGLDRTRGGLGLGLSLVRGLTDLHSGEVTAESEGLGKGARFTIRLPAAEAAEQPEELDEEVDAPARRRILIIEDNLDAAETTKMLLEREGHDVRTAHTGADGLEAAREFMPQVILCDIGLPGVDGYQVARTMRKDQGFGTPFIVALTGYGRDQDRRQAQEAGFDMHLTKPIDMNSLREALSHLPHQASGTGA